MFWRAGSKQTTKIVIKGLHILRMRIWELSPVVEVVQSRVLSLA